MKNLDFLSMVKAANKACSKKTAMTENYDYRTFPDTKPVTTAGVLMFYHLHCKGSISDKKETLEMILKDG